MQFSLQSASFSESEGEEDLLVPSVELITEYNRQYSMVVQQVDKFLTQVKDSVQKFVAFYNFGVGLHLPSLLDSLTCTERLFHQKCQQTEAANTPKQTAKLTYENTFHKLMQRMRDLLLDLLDCEIKFKQQYFGAPLQGPLAPSRTPLHAATTPPSRVTTRARSPPLNYSVISLTNSSKSSRVRQPIRIQKYKQEEQREDKREIELRETLNQKLKPTPAQVESECKKEYSTTQNLYRLNEKLDRLVGDMRCVRVREERLIELFDLNRVKKIHSAYQEETPFISTDISRIESVGPPGEQEEVDDFLDNYRGVRKNSDSFTDNKGPPRTGGGFAKKSRTFLDDLPGED